MYWLDILILIVLAVGLVTGLVHGLLWQIGRIVILVLAGYISVNANEPLTRYLQTAVFEQVDHWVASASAYVLVFLVSYFLLYWLLKLLQRTIQESPLMLMDRLFGGLLGVGKCAILVSIACAGISFVSLPITQSWMRQSKLAPHFARGTEAVVELIPDDRKADARDAIQGVRDWALRAVSNKTVEPE